MYGRILEDAGYAAMDGFEALRILRGEQVDLLLLDLRMPRKSGLEVFFGAIHLRPGIHVLVHSSYITGEETRRLSELGVTGHLQKPSGSLELLRTVWKILDEDPDSSPPFGMRAQPTHERRIARPAFLHPVSLWHIIRSIP